MTTALTGAQADALQRGTVSGAQVGPVASEIARRIGAGLLPTPTSSEGWADLVNQFTSNGAPTDRMAGTSSLAQINGARPGVQLNARATGSSSVATDPNGVDAFLGAVKKHESGGDYKAYNAAGGASGAYQYIQSTWSSYAKSAGYGQYANGPASNAPPEVQDAVAKYNANQLYGQSKSWKTAAESWYYPAWANDPAKQNSVPYPSAGNTLTIGAYGDQIVSSMGGSAVASNGAGLPTSDLGSIPAVDYARKQIGTNYVWGGEQEGVGFDCSGLVQAAFKNTGVSLPRVAQDQYNATTKVPSLDQAKAGDLVFYGADNQHITHVGIYLGNGEMVDAPHTGAQVRVEKLWGGEVGITRPTDHNGTTVLPQGSPAATAHADNTSAYYQALDQINAALNAKGLR